MLSSLALCLGAYLLQNGIFSHLQALASINVYVLTLVALSYLPSKIKPAYLGLFLGFLADLAYLDSFGFYTLAYFLLGVLVQEMIGYFNSNSLVSAALTGALSIFALNLITGVLGQVLAFGHSTEFVLLKTVSPSIFIHGFLAGGLFILMRKFGGGKHAQILD